MEKKDTNVLDAILKNYDGDTAAVYELWKRNSGLVPVRKEQLAYQVMFCRILPRARKKHPIL